MTGAKKETQPSSAQENGGKSQAGPTISTRIWLAGFVIVAMIFLFLLSFVGEKQEKSPGAISAPAGYSAPGAQARGLLQRMDLASLDKKKAQKSLLVDANSFFSAGNFTDAYIAYFALAREGNGEAAMKLAQMSDPQTADQFVEVTGGANYVQAIKWYQMAVAQQVSGAVGKLDRLLDHLRSMSRKGDLAAQRVLLEIE